jgi:hypothetical protein
VHHVAARAGRRVVGQEVEDVVGPAGVELVLAGPAVEVDRGGRVALLAERVAERVVPRPAVEELLVGGVDLGVDPVVPGVAVELEVGPAEGERVVAGPAVA